MDLIIDKTKKSNSELLIENRVPLRYLDSTFIFFMTNDYTIINEKLYSIGCREPEMNDYIEEPNIPYNIKKKMKELKTNWSFVLGMQDILYYYDFEKEKTYKINIRTLTHDGKTTATFYMFVSILYEKIDTIKYLIVNGYDLSLYHGYGFTDFMIACLYGKTKSAELLLENGSDVNAKDINNCTPLMHAVRRKVDIKIIRLILSKSNLKINDKNIYGRTALHIAVQKSNYEAFKLLIETGADVNAIDFSGQSVLDYAIIMKNFEMAVYLIKHNANVNYQDKMGSTPLMVAAYYGDLTIVERLIKAGANNIYKDNNNFTAFILAAIANKPRILKLLLDTFSIDEQEYIEALRQSIIYGNEKIVSILIDKSTNPTGMMYSSLLLACRADKEKIVQMCVEEKKCNPNINLICGMTPLIIAICENAINVVNKLIILNADINKADEDGITPLMYSASKNNQDIRKILLQNDADINARDKNGKTFEDYEQYFDSRSLAEIIDKRLQENHPQDFFELHEDDTIPQELHTFGECFYWFKQKYLKNNPKKKDSDIYKDGGFKKQYYSFVQKSLIKNPYFRPDDKYYVIRIAKGLTLTLKETEFFLHCSGYTFSERNKKDKIIIDLLKQGNYNIHIWHDRIYENTGENFFPAEFENDDEYLDDMLMMKKLKKVVL